MPYLQTPQSLNDIYNGPVGAFVPGMQLFGQQGERDQLTQQDQQRQLDYNTQADPMRLARMGLENQTTEAQLPGVAADSSIRSTAAKKASALSDADIKDMLGQYDSKELGRHVDDVEKLGTLLAQHGALAFSKPLGAAARTKAELEKLGHGDLWNSLWDQDAELGDPTKLPQRLTDMGNDMMDTSAKFRELLKIQEGKNDAGVEKARIAAQASMFASQQRTAAAMALVEQKREAMRTPKSAEDYGAKMQALAFAETDPTKKAQYAAEADFAFRVVQQFKDAAAQAGQVGKPYIPGMGIPDQGSVGRVPGLPANPQASASSPSMLSKLPQGTKDNGDGTFTMPDGRVIRAKK